jgi:cytochrome b561
MSGESRPAEERGSLATGGKVTGYSRMQVTLHWMVVVLVAFQFLAHDGIEDTWRAFVRGEEAPIGRATLTAMHWATGILVLLLALLRICLRLGRGAPSPPADEPRLLQMAAEAVHGSIYVLLLLLPITGAVAWFLGVRAAADVHALLTNLLLAAIVFHVAGALFQHFVRRSQVLMRMFRPQRP